MKKIFSIAFGAIFSLSALAVDMQAPMTSMEAQAAYNVYIGRQDAYYTGRFCPDSLRALWGEELFARLNELMGNTCRLNQGGYSYNSLRPEYVNVDKDLNNPGNIIGYYDGRSMNGTWDQGATYNREHTWPQSKGANKSICMGYDMQSVRPASTSVNGDRGNTPYGESAGYYDPSEIAIVNPLYVSSNNGTYRGDAARVILYDYIVYGSCAGHQSNYYNGYAQLLDKLGSDGVFESLEVLLSWHQTDMPSLTEMVRNDGAENYQGNRNPFIDFPELAYQLFNENPNPNPTPDPITPTAIHENSVNSVSKVLINGHVYIIRNEKVYTVFGL